MGETKYTKVYFRICPMEQMVWDYLKILNDNKTIYIRSLQQLSKTKENEIPTFWNFHTDYVFVNQSQTEIYNYIVPEVLHKALEGNDAIIMAYGQTGTGKSLTINGLTYSYENRGILPRIISNIFNNLKGEAQKNNLKYCLQVSYVEFSKNLIYDLLRSYPNNIFKLKELTKIKVKTVEETLRLLFTGEGRKIYTDNYKYPSHSCSSIFTFYINVKNGFLRQNKLHIIDFAGVDTIGNLSSLFKNPSEIGAANLAKTQLEQFFLCVCTGVPEKIRIKQKVNPMINFLGNSLNKTSVLRVIGHIRVSREDLLITISMLRFGQLLGGVKALKYDVPTEKHITKEDIENLKNELTKLRNSKLYDLTHQALNKSLNEERFAHVERTINEFLHNKITQISLLNICEINIALDVFKTIYKKLEQETLTSVTKIKRISSSASQRKSSKSSTKSQSIDKLSKKIEKTSSEKMRAQSASTFTKKTSQDKAASVNTLNTKSKTSSSTILKKASSTRRKSTSRSSIRDKSSEDVLKLQIPPEYQDAWNSYITERNEEYNELIESYKRNESAAKEIYRNYLKEIDALTSITSAIEKHKNDLFLAKMTRQFYEANTLNSQNTILNNFEECCLNELKKAEGELLEKQEFILKCQSEIRTYMNLCNEEKKIFSENFKAFCLEKYQTPVPVIESAEILSMNIEETIIKSEQIIEITPEEIEAKIFERFKKLIDLEKRKRQLYEMKQREWVTY